MAKLKKIIKKFVVNNYLKWWSFKTRNFAKKIIYIGSPLHGNLGDHAISIAINKILTKINLPYIEIPGEYYRIQKAKVDKLINKNDIIMITGGGFVGDVWQEEEKLVESIIDTYLSNKIIIMPQTITFDKNKSAFAKFKKVACSHRDLHICVREKKSFDFCKDNLSNDIIMLPDVVLSLKYNFNYKRDGVLFILRDDVEKSINFECINYGDIDNVKYASTVLTKRVSLCKRYRELEKILKKISNSRCVVTDRLHGMIFSAITNTPCIAFNNKNGKVKEVYNAWLRKCNYITIEDDPTKLTAMLKKVLKNNKCDYDLNEDYYAQLIDKISELINKD